jgi:hypothetical protein
MATRICVPNILPLEKDVIKVRIPSATTLYQGSLVVAESLEGTSRSVYTGSLVTDITKDTPAIVINQGVYEDANGVRVEGYVNPGDMSYQAGDVVTAVRPEKNLIFTMSADCYTGTAVKDQYIIPAVGVEKPAVSATIGTAVLAYKVEQLVNIPVGNTFVSGVLVRLVLGA